MRLLYELSGAMKQVIVDISRSVGVATAQPQAHLLQIHQYAQSVGDSECLM